MPKLSDIVASTRRKYIIGDVVFELAGLSAQQLAKVFERFPEANDLVSASGGDEGTPTIDLVRRLAPAAGGLIAAGLGVFDDESELLAAAQLPAGTQVDLVNAVVRLTFADAPAARPFVEPGASLPGAPISAQPAPAEGDPQA